MHRLHAIINVYPFLQRTLSVNNMKPKTAELWAKQDQHQDDRWRLFSAVDRAIDAAAVLYPGSYIDVAPSFVFKSVTYVDVDRRAPKFFSDTDGVREIVADHGDRRDPEIAFIHADYMSTLDLPENHFDLLVSLYAGFISEHCTHHLRIGGTLLVNPSHGDAAMASIDPRYELSAVIISCDGNYKIDSTGLDGYLIPKKQQTVTIAGLHKSGRGIGYTKSPFAYLFTRIA